MQQEGFEWDQVKALPPGPHVSRRQDPSVFFSSPDLLADCQGLEWVNEQLLLVPLKFHEQSVRGRL